MKLPIEIHFERQDGLHSYVDATLTTDDTNVSILIVGTSTFRTDDGHMEGVYRAGEVRFPGKRIRHILVTQEGLLQEELHMIEAARQAGYVLERARS